VSKVLRKATALTDGQMLQHLSRSLQIKNVGMHRKGYHYILAVLVSNRHVQCLLKSAFDNRNSRSETLVFMHLKKDITIHSRYLTKLFYYSTSYDVFEIINVHQIINAFTMNF